MGLHFTSHPGTLPRQDISIAPKFPTLLPELLGDTPSQPRPGQLAVDSLKPLLFSAQPSHPCPLTLSLSSAAPPEAAAGKWVRLRGPKVGPELPVDL